MGYTSFDEDYGCGDPNCVECYYIEKCWKHEGFDEDEEDKEDEEE